MTGFDVDPVTTLHGQVYKAKKGTNATMHMGLSSVRTNRNQQYLA